MYVVGTWDCPEMPIVRVPGSDCNTGACLDIP